MFCLLLAVGLAVLPLSEDVGTANRAGEAEIEVLGPRAPVSLHAEGAASVGTVRKGGRLRGGAFEPGLYARGGFIVVPNFILERFFSSYSNALCRSEIGEAAREQGANRVDGCNLRIGGGVQWMRRRLVIQAGIDHTRLRMPDSNWLAKGEDLASADLTQIRLHLTTLTVGLFAELPLKHSSGRRRVSLSWRLGGNVGLGFLGGGIYRTKLGTQTQDCDLAALGDLSLCRPYRPVEFTEAGRDSPHFADCTVNSCSEADLIRAGRRQLDDLPRVVPVLHLSTGPRLTVGHRTGIAAEVGAGVGFSFGLSLDTQLGRRTHASRAR